MKGRVLDVNERKTSKGKEIYDVNVQGEDNKTIKYQCWDAAIKEKSGKEIEFTVKESDNPSFPTPTLILPKGDGNTFQKGKGFSPRATSPEQLETMILSYKKDCMLKCIDIALAVSGRSDKHLDEKEISKMAVECYKIIGKPLFAHKDEDAAPKS